MKAGNPREYARLVVDNHTRGIICPGEVWGQFIGHATAETFAEWMSELTPELQVYFRGVLVDRADVFRSDEREALRWLSEYFKADEKA
jgi:hypothetical protein